MHIVDFSLDVWKLIIDHGQLEIGDVLNMMLTCKPLAVTLRHNLIWYTLLYDNYLKALEWFDLDRAKEIMKCRESLNHRELEYFDLCMTFYQKDRKFRDLLMKNNNDIRYYLDEFSEDDDYIPIIYNLCENLRKRYTEMIIEGEDIPIGVQGICLNLLKSHTFRIGMKYVAGVVNTPDFQNPPSLEQFWLHVSLLDPNAFEMVKYRSIAMKKIAKLLHTEITTRMFYNMKGTTDIQLIMKDNLPDILVFKDEDTLIKLIIHMFKLILSCLEFNNPLIPLEDKLVLDKYSKSYYIEDFSILRIYSGQVKGHPFLLMSILIKVVEEFLTNRYEIRLQGFEEPQTIQMDITSTYLRVRQYLFSFDRKILTLSADFEIYTVNEVVQNLRDRSYFEISKFIEPLGFKYIVDCYLNLDYFMDCKSLGLILRPDFYFIKGSTVSSLGDASYGLVSYKHYSFIKLICRYIQDKETDTRLLGSIFCQELEKMLNQMNTFIHFRTVYQLLDKTPNKQEQIKRYFFNEGSANFSFTNCLDLQGSIGSKVSFDRIFNSSVDAFTTEETGAIIRHNKFDNFGVIIGKLINIGGTTFYRVYTTKRTFEMYSEQSVTVVDAKSNHLPQLMNFVIKSCGEEILSLMTFSKLINPNNNPKFVTSDDYR